MSSTRNTLARIDNNLSESMGERTAASAIRLSPEAHPRDAGRRPLPRFGSIEIDRVAPDPDQPRSEFSDEAIDRLAASLQCAGQLAPIRVRWSETTGTWLIVAGERRWRAAKAAGLPSVECFFYDNDLTDGEVLQLQMIENLLREDLKPIEEARGFRRMMQLHGYTGKQVAAALSVPESKVSRSLALLRLPVEIQHHVEVGKIAPRTAYELSRFDDPAQQQRLAKQAVASRVTHDDIAKKVRQRRGKRSRKPPGVKLTFSSDGSWQVVVSRAAGGNYHEVQQALEQAIDEVRRRIRGGVQLF